MQVGLIGVGKIGGGIMRRLTAAGHEVVAYDRAPGAAKTIRSSGAASVASLKQLVRALPPPRVVWLMIPAPAVSETVAALLPLLTANDILIDGGNSYFKDSVARATAAGKRKIHFIDVGVSGGVAGEQQGYAIMAGGTVRAIKKLQPI